MRRRLRLGWLAGASIWLAGWGAQADEDAQASLEAGSDAQEAGTLADGVAVAPPPVSAGPETLPVVSGMSVRLTAPPGWVADQEAELASLDLSEVTGARVALSRAWRGPRPPALERGRHYRDSMFLVCVEAPVTEWAPGLEQLILEEMNLKAREELGKHASLDAFEPGPVERTEAWFRQAFKAHGELGAGHRKGQVRELQAEPPDRPHNHARNTGVHLLTVPARAENMVACTLACGETERPGQTSFVCDASVSSLEALGELSAEPAVTTLGKLLVGLKRRPLAAAGAGAGMLMVLMGLVLVVVGAVRRSRAAVPKTQP